jgi:hypothetical protein
MIIRGSCAAVALIGLIVITPTSSSARLIEATPASTNAQGAAPKTPSNPSGGTESPPQSTQSAGKGTAGTENDRPDAGKAGAPAKDSEKGEAQKKKEEPQVPVAIQWTTAILDKLLSWVLVALVFLLVFRARLEAFFDGVTNAMTDRGVTVEVAKVKIQVSERSQDLYEERGRRFSVSPFDLETDSYDGFASSLDLPAQVTFQVSDYAATWWSSHFPKEAEQAVAAAARTFGALNEKLKQASTLDAVKQELTDFALALEKARFIDAARLEDLVEKKPGIRAELVALATKVPSKEEKAILHATGVAYMQSSDWATARKLLEPIAWVSGQPGYLPAADAWLATKYQDDIAKARCPGSKTPPDAFLKALRSAADDVVNKATSILGAMPGSTDWPTPGNADYYYREVNKVLGTVASFRADYSESSKERKDYLQRALEACKACSHDIGGEKASPLDHNNLADTYRQLGSFDRSDYGRAHKEVHIALSDSPHNPTFVNTEASIFIDEGNLDRAFDILTATSPEQIEDESPDLVQYVDNQILAAKVISGTSRPRIVRLSRAADILEAAVRLLREKAARLEAEEVRLTAELNELLGFTYLGLPGYERSSVECYERLAPLWDLASTTTEVRWRRRLGGVRAYTWLARASRRDFDYGTAANQRQRGRKVINDNLEELDAFRLEKGQPTALLLRQARIKLDTAMALQGLAEESFHGGELADAKELLDKKDSILVAVRDFREDDTIGAKVRLAGALTGLLRGWLVFHGDPGTYDPAVLTEIEKNLLSARGQNAMLDCQVDLALGEAFLAAALAGKPADAPSNYRKAIGVLERAVGPEAPAALRADATRVLIDAYGQQSAVQRRTARLKST